MSDSRGEPPAKTKRLYSAADAWRDHRTACELCLRVNISRPGTLAYCCYSGAILLKAALFDAHDEKRVYP